MPKVFRHLLELRGAREVAGIPKQVRDVKQLFSLHKFLHRTLTT
jgi:hypothetical protein